MQYASARIWTRVAVANSYDDNHYTTGIYKKDIEPVDISIVMAQIDKMTSWQYASSNQLATANQLTQYQVISQDLKSYISKYQIALVSSTKSYYRRMEVSKSFS